MTLKPADEGLVTQIWPVMAVAGSHAVTGGTPGVSVQIVPQSRPASGVHQSAECALHPLNVRGCAMMKWLFSK